MYLIYKANYFEPWLSPNEFGDMFGFMSCIFSGLAFAGLIITIRQQKEDLELQRKELQRANNEAAYQTKQFEAQTKQFEEQIKISLQNQIKDAFYRRLSFLKQLEHDIIYRWKTTYHNSATPKDLQVSGQSAVEQYYDNYKQSVHYHNNENWKACHPCTSEAFRVWMRSFFTLVDDLMNHYKDEDSRRFYIRILINSTSLHERALLYFDHTNLGSVSVNKIMKYLLEKEFINPALFPNN